MEVRFYDRKEIADDRLNFAVVVSRQQGKWVYCRHRKRESWEIPGGHREPGEEILETARRELFEETGASVFDLKPVCVYAVVREQESYGLLCLAEIAERGPLPESEIAEIRLFDAPPPQLTYPDIQPKLLEKIQQWEREMTPESGLAVVHETPRLLLRPWSMADAADLYRYAKNPAVGPAAGWPAHESEAHSRKIIETVLAVPETYAVVYRETGEVIGSVGLLSGQACNADLPYEDLEVGYWIGEPFWGRGLIPEAVHALLRHGFETLQAQAIWGIVYEENEKSQRVQEKCGLRYHHAGELKGLMGQRKPARFYRLKREDWRMGQAALEKGEARP